MTIMLAGALFVVVYPFPLFALLDTAEPAIVQAAMVVGFGGASALFGPMAAFLADLFPPRSPTAGSHSATRSEQSSVAACHPSSPASSRAPAMAPTGACRSTSPSAGAITVGSLLYLRGRAATNQVAEVQPEVPKEARSA